jgi:uncharacterized protein (DUF885 family)
MPTTPTTDNARQIDALAEEMFAVQLRTAPVYATQIGYPEFAGELPDLTRSGVEQRRLQLSGLAERIQAVDPSTLDTERAITHEMLLRTISDELLSAQVGAYDYTVTPIPQTGLAASVIIGFPKTPIRTNEDAEGYLARCQKLPAWLDVALERLARGRAAGRTPVRRLVANALEQLDGYLGSALTDDPLLSVPDPVGGRASSWRDRLVGVVRDEVRPAFASYRDHLAREILETARSDDQVGLAHLQNGVELYQRLAATHTTTDLSIADIHQTGLELVAELTDEMRELGAKTLGLDDFAGITNRLRTDPDLFFGTSDEVQQAAEDALNRAQQELPRWLGLLPTIPCQVIPMTPYEVENGDLGHYQWPTRDGSRPGTYWINTYKPQTRPRFESQTLAFHESVPGHHTQLALSQELGAIPEFRQHAHVTAFSEGWALYVERLADEMGLYSGDIYRLGMISFDFWRACRLVVDTGMHALGWSRDRAVNYMLEHSALTPKNIENEIDRYIGWPGQALGYMIGRLEIRRLRGEAERRLGDRFNLPEFHSTVIGHGSLPLSVLGQVVERWITREERPNGHRSQR